MTADLDAALAAEEHRQGAPYVAEPGHCGTCAEVDRAWAQATCEHGDWVSIRDFGDPHDTQLCSWCGETIKVVVR